MEELPLYVIDGFIAGTGYNLSNLNVNDIESIQVLKDASSLALYGTRGASGVILINTKSGKASKVGTVNVAVNHYTTFASVTRMPQTADPKPMLNIGRRQSLLYPAPMVTEIMTLH